MNNGSACFKCDEVPNLIDAPALHFPAVPCLEPIVTKAPGIVDAEVTVKVVSLGSQREGKYGRMEKAILKDICGFR